MDNDWKNTKSGCNNPSHVNLLSAMEYIAKLEEKIKVLELTIKHLKNKTEVPF